MHHTKDNISETNGTKLKMPAVYYSTLVSAVETALNYQAILTKKLGEIANK